MFKKVYIEILNYCNLNCSFCVKTVKPKRKMSVDEFKLVITNIKNYTNSIYLHIQGEPLLHPELKELLDICNNNNITVNITTNGTLLNEQSINTLSHEAIRQINISMQALIDNYNTSELNQDIINKLSSLNKIINIRYWTIKELNINKVDNFYYSYEEEFKWPSLNDPINPNPIKCFAFKNQLGILSNGSVVSCCLDKDGHTTFGNIFSENLEDILNSSKFKNRSKEELCLRCTYRNRFNKD